MKTKLPCAVVKDLLPSYIDELTSDETGEVIREHMEECESCRRILEAMSGDVPKQEACEEEREEDRKEVDYLRKQKRKNRFLLILIPVMALAFLIGSVTYYRSRRPVFDFQEFAVGAKQGDTFSLGRYEQDGDTENGEEEIVWIVLSNSYGGMIAMAKYGLTSQPFHTVDEDVIWEQSSLREWLNTEFYETAFSDSEKKLLSAKVITNNGNPYYNTPGGDPTTDVVFLPTLKDVEGLPMDISTCFPTRAGREAGIVADSQTGHCGWWLRTPGIAADTACIGDTSGYSNGIGTRVNVPGLAVRPCIVIRY